MTVKHEQDPFQDEYMMNEEEQLWHRINNNAKFQTERYESDPRVDTRLFALD